MAEKCAPHYAYTVVYVKDVSKSVDFYSKAFGLTIRRLDHSRRWGELESGSTTIAFTPIEQHEMEITEKGEEHNKLYDLQRNKLELCFTYHDLDSAFKRAVERGAVMVAEPEEKEWGQKVGYVRDIDGHVVRLGSVVVEHKH